MKKFTMIFVLTIFALNVFNGYAQPGCEGDTEPPVVLQITGPTDPVKLGSEVTITASFADACGSPHTVIWDWGEINYPIPTTIVEPTENEPGQIVGNYVYSFPGVYTVSMTIVDDYSNSTEALFQFVVIYSVSAGFVTGGGWIDSPEGAYAPDPALTGKANFGFVAKYKKGQSEPEGNTQFSFKVADFQFKSTEYDWLVIAGPQAKFKGSGTINGSGDYGFMLTARDGQAQGGGGEDRFRIKIWEKDASETVIYDNQMNDPEDADATDIIEGGSIVIHETTFDETPPVVIIASPFDELYTNRTPIAISWMVDGITQTTQLSEDLVEGSNMIVRSATDDAGNVGADTVTVIYDITPPVVAIISPEENILTNQTPIDITWTVDGVAQIDQLTADLVEGENWIIRSAEDEAGNMGADTVLVILDTIPPEVVIVSPEDGTVTDVTPIDVNWTVDGIEQNMQITEDLIEGDNFIIRSVVDEAGNVGSDMVMVTYFIQIIPPDPATIAPPVDSTVVTTMHAAVEFLYTGVNPIQTGVDSGTIEPKRTAVLRGKVLNRDNDPLSGVTITILNHPEFGQTLSRADGWFDLVVNGGGYLTVDYQLEDFLSLQRQVNVPWQDYVVMDSVVMVGLDPVATVIDFSEPVQVAQGSVVTDEDGTRQATLLFMDSTEVEMVMPDSSVQPLSSITVRATEYTVGENGPAAMPAELPPNVAYTYCVELSCDEAIQAGAKSVLFDQPVPFYVDNFLDFPVGTIVPVGYYDRERALWVPSDNGCVIKILSITNDMVDIDTDGDGVADIPDSLSVWGITDQERVKLAELYSPGRSLWRAEVTHLTSFDHNWPWGPPENATAPGQPEPVKDEIDNACPIPQSSTIGIQNQTLGESYPVIGTGINLHYQSDRVPGRIPVIDIPLSGATVPSSLKNIKLIINVAGQEFQFTYSANPNQKHRFIWDGVDAYGRFLFGLQKVNIKIGYVYEAVYKSPSTRERTFGQWGIDAIRESRGDIILWENMVQYIGTANHDMGGWSLDVHHIYDPQGMALYLGDGSRRSYLENIIDTDVGPDEIQDRSFFLTAVGPDGTVYLAGNPSQIYRLNGNGTISPAFDAEIEYTEGIDIGPDGSIYIAETLEHRIRKIDPNGNITTIAGTGIRGYSGDGGPATEANLQYPYGVTVGDDGAIYILDYMGFMIRKIAQDNMITTIAGSTSGGYDGDGGPAINSRIQATDITVGPDGCIYIADFGNHRIRKISFDGIITTVAGSDIQGRIGDGGPATEACLSYPGFVNFSPDGKMYISDDGYKLIRIVSQDGLINTFAGTGETEFNGDGILPINANIRAYDIAITPDGNVYLPQTWEFRVRKIKPVFPEFTSSEIEIASDDGSEIYQCNDVGKHLRTLDALTGIVKYAFSYDENGLLSHITDMDSLVTTIERDAEGNPTSILSPFGQRTALALDESGYLESITNPAGETVSFTYTDGGLMTSQTDARGNASYYAYDELGRLIYDEDAAGGYKTLAKTDLENGWETTLTTAEGLTQTYRVEQLPDGTRQMTNTFENGLSNVAVNNTDGTSSVTFPDGTVTTKKLGPDPRFGMEAPLIDELTVSTPGGLTSTMSQGRIITQISGLEVTGLTDTVTVNGKKTASVYDGNIGLFTTTSPEGRNAFSFIDDKGRVVQDSIPGIESVHYTYDDEGFLIETEQGDRRTTFAYNDQGWLESVTDPLSRTTTMAYDSVGRVVQQIMADGREILYDYDANGNLISLMPPGKPEHTFSHTPVNLTELYIPPAVPDSAGATGYVYNLDRQIVRTILPDSSFIDVVYDTTGCVSCGGGSKPKEIIFDRGVTEFNYSETTGQLSEIVSPTLDTLRYTYDGSLPTSVEWSGSINGSVGVNYNNDFRVVSQSVNGGNAVSFSYDDDGLLTGAGALSINRDPLNGLMAGSGLGNVTTGYDYNAFGEVTNFVAQYNSTDLFSTDYSLDSLGRITEITETVQGKMDVFFYSYDLSGRLETVTRNDTLISTYTYDDNGNRLSHTSLSGTVFGTYDDQDRMLSYGSLSYGYTANGSLTFKAEGVDTTWYNYDNLGNLISVLLPDGTFIEYLIDGQNRRVGKLVNSVFKKGWIYQDQINPVAELDSLGQISARFVYGSKGHVPDYIIRDDSTYYVITDHLGSVRLIVNEETGNVVQSISYDEFGNVISDTNSEFQPFGYAGGLVDGHTGLVRFGARDYVAEVGRWTAKDPIGFYGDYNLYIYSHVCPLSYIDPTGFYNVGSTELRLTYETYGLFGLTVSAITARRAGDIARDSDLTGEHNGPQDAYRHCVWSCLMKRTAGEKFATNIANFHEIQNLLDKQPMCETIMDQHNNREGRDAADQKGSCKDNCMQKYCSGALQNF